jgi:hypothetical protein
MVNHQLHFFAGMDEAYLRKVSTGAKWSPSGWVAIHFW